MNTEQPTPPAVLLSTAQLGTNTATASTVTAKALTPGDLERTAQVVRNLPPEPLGVWMRSQGRPPEQWRVVLPQSMRNEVNGPMFWPDYVAFSPVIDRPVFVPHGLWAWDMAPNAESNGAKHPTRTLG